MMKHLLAWGGGASLCCSAIAFAALKDGPTVHLAWAGILLASACHAATGYLAITEAGVGKGVRRDAILFSAAAALLWTIIQAGFALGLASALQIQVSNANAIWMLAIGSSGSALLLVIASRSYPNSIDEDLDLGNRPAHLRDTATAEITRG